MNIVFIANHCCIRVQKFAVPLINAGHKVHLITYKIPARTAPLFESITLCADVENLQEAVKSYSKIADIFHAHNEPSWFVSVVKETTNTPVILDVHDTYLTRSTEEESQAEKEQGKSLARRTTDERTNFKLADGLNFVTGYAKEAAYTEYNLNQPFAVIPSYVPWEWYSQESLEWLGGLVYEGKVTIGEELRKTSRVFNYCNYEELAKQAHAAGLDLHLYGMRTDEAYEKVYGDIAFTHIPTNGIEIIRRITRHDWGLLGNIFPHPQWQKTSTNKMFEYIAAGVPVVAMNAQWSEEFVTKHEIGIAVHSLEELLENWSKHTEIRKTLIKKRRQFSMEEHIDDILDLYESVL